MQRLPCRVAGHDLENDPTVNVGQANISPAEPSGQSGVVYTEKVQHVGMQVMYREPVFDRTVPEFVGGPVKGSSTDSAAGHPRC